MLQNNEHVIIPVIIKKSNDDNYIYVLFDAFMEERKKISEFYSVSTYE